MSRQIKTLSGFEKNERLPKMLLGTKNNGPIGKRWSKQTIHTIYRCFFSQRANGNVFRFGLYRMQITEGLRMNENKLLPVR